MADLKDMMREVVGTVDNHETSEREEEADLEEEVSVELFSGIDPAADEPYGK